jgi:hypothetical protein
MIAAQAPRPTASIDMDDANEDDCQPVFWSNARRGMQEQPTPGVEVPYSDRCGRIM